jgi:uncharacterized membrane protein
VGGPVFNLILLGYGIPALLAGALALIARANRPLAYRYIAASAAVALALLYLTLEVRRIYHGSTIAAFAATGDAEQYTYSAVWLGFGVALLAVGYILKATSVRMASAAVVIATVLKVFFVDMHDLAGLWQALSVLGLGVVLLGIGWFYQRLLFPRRLAATPPVT